MRLHHAYICCAPGAPEALLLEAAGLTQGSPTVHVGQGTSSRRFFFATRFLELIFVHNSVEAAEDMVGPFPLWARWSKQDNASRFGLCFSSADGAARPEGIRIQSYRPEYLPGGRELAFVSGLSIREPEVFFLGWPQPQATPTIEPRLHPLGLAHLARASIGLSQPRACSPALRAIANAGLLDVHESNLPELVLTFASDTELRVSIPELQLVLIGQASQHPRSRATR